MRRHTLAILATLAVLTIPVTAWTVWDDAGPGEQMTKAASAWLASLTDEQRETVLHDYDDELRVGWHFIPMEYRKGLQVRDMTPDQRELATELLRSSLSAMGYQKAERIMQFESLLNEFEKGAGRFLRDPERYYFTLFGEPSNDGRWGLSIEGHHLSLNFVVENGRVSSSTPQFFAANPAVVLTTNSSGMPFGERILGKEELLAFTLVNSLDDSQLTSAVIAETAPEEIRAAGEPQPPQEAPVGIVATELSMPQLNTLKELIEEYIAAMPHAVAEERRTDLEAAGMEAVHFAWAGAREPGIGHYYRIQGATFLIEFVNTQPDAAGNPANHIHCVWRDMRGDFAIPVGQ
jgi:hypothetical protein